MSSRLPDEIQPLLEEFVAELGQQLPGFLSALYVQGSIALGAFNPHLSDIDFVAVISRRCTASDIECLTELHKAFQQKYPLWLLEGSYLQWGDLGKFEDSIKPHPHCHDGILQPCGYHDINSVTWWILRNYGVAVFGPDPEKLDFTVDWDLLITNMRENLNTYWVSYTTQPARIAWLLSNYGIQWAVLGVLRQYYTFNEHAIASKTGAGEYALVHLPQQWHRIVQEALNIRNQTADSLYSLRVARAVEAFRFLKYIIRACNNGFAQ